MLTQYKNESHKNLFFLQKYMNISCMILHYSLIKSTDNTKSIVFDGENKCVYKGTASLVH